MQQETVAAPPLKFRREIGGKEQQLETISDILCVSRTTYTFNVFHSISYTTSESPTGKKFKKKIIHNPVNQI